MRILLINPQISWQTDTGLKLIRTRTFSDYLGIRYIASFLEEKGHHVDIIDSHFEEISEEELFKRCGADKWDMYGISFVEPIVDLAMSLGKYIKEINPEGLLLIGGYGATLCGEMLLKDFPFIDAAILGEGELTLGEIVDKVDSGNGWHEVEGIMFLKDGIINKTPPRQLIQDIDSMPWPTRGPMEHYGGKANIIASRGCYGVCSYCCINEFYKRTPGKKVRIRKAEKVVDEMEYLHKNFNIDHVSFVDDNFTGILKIDKTWAKTFVDEMNRRNLHMSWGIQARANDIEEEVFSLLYRGGLRIVSLGIETDIERVMKLFKTGTTREIHRKSIEILRKLNFQLFVEMIMFEPTTTLEEIKQNINFLEEINIHDIYRQNIVSTYPRLAIFRGLPLIEEYKKMANLYDSGYRIDYEFNDERVQKLYDIINKWQVLNEETISLHNGYLHYRASTLGMVGLSIEAVKLCKQYLKFDLNFIKDAVTLIMKKPQISNGDMDYFIEGYVEGVEDIKNRFLVIYEKIYAKALSANP